METAFTGFCVVALIIVAVAIVCGAVAAICGFIYDRGTKEGAKRFQQEAVNGKLAEWNIYQGEIEFRWLPPGQDAETRKVVDELKLPTEEAAAGLKANQ